VAVEQLKPVPGGGQVLAEHQRQQCRAFFPVVVIVVGVVVAGGAAAGDVVDRQVPCLFAGQQGDVGGAEWI